MLLYRHVMDSKPRSGGLAGDEKRIFMDMVEALTPNSKPQADPCLMSVSTSATPLPP